MSTADLRAQAAPPPAPWTWWAGGAVAALALGVAAASGTTLGIAVGIGLALVVRALQRPATILTVLVLSIFLELLKTGTLTISRALAPIALLVAVIELLRRRGALAKAP